MSRSGCLLRRIERIAENATRDPLDASRDQLETASRAVAAAAARAQRSALSAQRSARVSSTGSSLVSTRKRPIAVTGASPASVDRGRIRRLTCRGAPRRRSSASARERGVAPAGNVASTHAIATSSGLSSVVLRSRTTAARYRFLPAAIVDLERESRKRARPARPVGHGNRGPPQIFHDEIVDRMDAVHFDLDAVETRRPHGRAVAITDVR